MKELSGLTIITKNDFTDMIRKKISIIKEEDISKRTTFISIYIHRGGFLQDVIIRFSCLPLTILKEQGFFSIWVHKCCETKEMGIHIDSGHYEVYYDHNNIGYKDENLLDSLINEIKKAVFKKVMEEGVLY